MSSRKIAAKQCRNICQKVAYVQARLPARTECEREFHVLGPTEQRERSPMVKMAVARQGESESVTAGAGL